MPAAGSRSRLAAAWLGLAASAACASAGITAVYRGQRALMVESGGVCAGGGPYEIANPCDGRQVALLLGGFAAILVAAAVHSALTGWVDGPRVGVFAILGATFAAMGWNFVQLGVDDPQTGGTVAGWLASGAVFWLMAPAFAAGALMRAAEWARRGGRPEAPAFPPELLESVFGRRP